MRTKPLRRKSKTPAAKQKEILWQLCKQITRNRYRREDGSYRCFTCDKEVDVPQTGHFIPSAACGAYLRYDLRNLRLQCFYCNINLGGNGAEFYKRLVAEVGQDQVDKLFSDKNVLVKADKHFYQELIDRYELEASK
jgi:hypothetical protein